MKIQKLLFFLGLIVLFSCETESIKLAEEQFKKAPLDYRIMTTGTVDVNGDTISIKHWEYNAEGRYIDGVIKYEDGVLVHSMRPGRAQRADYFYGNDRVLDIMATGVYYRTYDDILNSPMQYYIIVKPSYNKQGQITSYHFTYTIPRDNPQEVIEWTVNFTYEKDAITITQGSSIIKYTYSNKMNFLPKEYRFSHFWEGWLQDYSRHLTPRLPLSKIEISNDNKVTDLASGYTFNEYSYPSKRELEDGGHQFFIYNYD